MDQSLTLMSGSTVWTALVILMVAQGAQAWGSDAHAIICDVAQAMLSTEAANAVNELLPESAGGNLSSLCSWADEVRYTSGYSWSAPLHFINTPDEACNYNYNRDCENTDGVPGMCSAGAMNNYTSQLTSNSQQYNLTEALLFLAHITGDIHQPLHCGFTSDLGGNTIQVYWYNQNTNLHHVWDTPIIYTAEDDFYSSNAGDMFAAIYANVTGVWSDEAKGWETCSGDSLPCPDTYAAESINLACLYAYADVSAGDTLQDSYFYSRIPVVQKRLGQAGVRLAALLNSIFASNTT